MVSNILLKSLIDWFFVEGLERERERDIYIYIYV